VRSTFYDVHTVHIMSLQLCIIMPTGAQYLVSFTKILLFETCARVGVMIHNVGDKLRLHRIVKQKHNI
jgi:hypothetical protein